MKCNFGCVFVVAFLLMSLCSSAGNAVSFLFSAYPNNKPELSTVIKK